MRVVIMEAGVENEMGVTFTEAALWKACKRIEGKALAVTHGFDHKAPTVGFAEKFTMDCGRMMAEVRMNDITDEVLKEQWKFKAAGLVPEMAVDMEEPGVMDDFQLMAVGIFPLVWEGEDEKRAPTDC